METKKLNIVAFSGDLDKLLAVFVIATGAAASGMEVSVFTTFWGTSVMRKLRTRSSKKGFFEKLFSFLLPKGPDQLKLSKMNMCGMGSWAMKHLMKKNILQTLQH